MALHATSLIVNRRQVLGNFMLRKIRQLLINVIDWSSQVVGSGR